MTRAPWVLGFVGCVSTVAAPPPPDAGIDVGDVAVLADASTVTDTGRCEERPLPALALSPDGLGCDQSSHLACGRWAGFGYTYALCLVTGGGTPTCVRGNTYQRNPDGGAPTVLCGTGPSCGCGEDCTSGKLGFGGYRCAPTWRP